MSPFPNKLCPRRQRSWAPDGRGRGRGDDGEERRAAEEELGQRRSEEEDYFG